LDPSQLVEVRALIKSLAKNKTVILSSHILSEVEQICDRIYMIQNGTITSLDDMKNDNIWLVRFDAEVRPKWFESVGEVINASSHLVEIEIKKESDKGEIFDIAVQNQVRITEMRAKERALESVFLDEQP